MSSKRYHINKDGVPAICRARPGNCPYGGVGGDENHFDSIEEAQAAANKMNEAEFSLLPSKTKEAFTQAETDEDFKKIEERFEFLRERDRRKRRNTGGRSSNYVSRCREAEFLPDYEPNNIRTRHFQDDRTSKEMRLSETYGEGEVVGYYRIDHKVRTIDGTEGYKNQIGEIRDNGRLTIYDYHTGRKVTTFMAHEERVEVMMLHSNQIPDETFLSKVKDNFRSESDYMRQLRQRQAQ